MFVCYHLCAPFSIVKASPCVIIFSKGFAFCSATLGYPLFDWPIGGIWFIQCGGTSSGQFERHYTICGWWRYTCRGRFCPDSGCGCRMAVNFQQFFTCASIDRSHLAFVTWIHHWFVTVYGTAVTADLRADNCSNRSCSGSSSVARWFQCGENNGRGKHNRVCFYLVVRLRDRRSHRSFLRSLISFGMSRLMLSVCVPYRPFNSDLSFDEH